MRNPLCSSRLEHRLISLLVLNMARLVLHALVSSCLSIPTALVVAFKNHELTFLAGIVVYLMS